MAFPTIRHATGGESSATSTNHAIVLPSPIEPGDRIIIVATVDGSGTPSLPAGWTAIPNAQGPTGSVSGAAVVGAWYKDAVGNEDGTTVTMTTPGNENSSWAIYVLTAGTFTGAPVATGAVGTSVNPNPPSLTSGFGAVDALWLVFSGNDHGQRTYSVYPTNYTNGAFYRSNNTGGTVTATARRTQAAASDDPATFTVSTSEEWRAVTLAIKGAVPPTSVSPSPAAAATATPTATATAGRRVAPSPAAAATATPTATATAGRRATPDPVAATLATPAPTVVAPTRVAPDPVAATLATPAIQATRGARVEPAPASTTTSAPAPTVYALEARLVAPDPVPTATATPTATARAGRLVAPDVVATATAAPGATATAGRRATPDPVATTTAAPSITLNVGGRATAAPEPVTLELEIPIPDVTAETGPPAIVTPEPVELQLLALAATAIAGRRLEPEPAAATPTAPGGTATALGLYVPIEYPVRATLSRASGGAGAIQRRAGGIMIARRTSGGTIAEQPDEGGTIERT